MEVNDFKIRFGKLVKKYREKNGLTQMDVARLIYRDEEKSSRVSDVERGRHDPQAVTIADYREALEIPQEEIDELRDDRSLPEDVLELRRFKAEFESCALETSFDALISGEGIVTLAMGYSYYENLHKGYMPVQLEYAYVAKHTQEGDLSAAERHREHGELLLSTLKQRVAGIPESALLKNQGVAQDTNKLVHETRQELSDQRYQVLAATLEVWFTGPLFKPKIWVQLYSWCANDDLIEFVRWDGSVFAQVPEVIAALGELRSALQGLMQSAPPDTIILLPEAIRNCDSLLAYARTHDTYPRENEEFYWEASRRYLDVLKPVRAILEDENLNGGFTTFWIGEIDKIVDLAGDIDNRKI